MFQFSFAGNFSDADDRAFIADFYSSARRVLRANGWFLKSLLSRFAVKG
jgi:hypothetical protein